MIKMIAIDLDGTFLNDNKKVSRRNLEALHYADQKGIKIVIATGRTYAGMKNFVEEIGFVSENDYIITFNGGQIQKAATGEIVKNSLLTVNDLNLWYPILTDIELPMNILAQDIIYEPLAYPKGYKSLYIDSTMNQTVHRVDYGSFSEDTKFNKFIIATESTHIDRQIQLVEEEIKNNYMFIRSYDFLLEIGNKGVTKGSSLVKLAEHLGIDMSEVMAIGDQMNDYMMLEYAGKGIAMGNAIPQIKRIADDITGTNNDDGVAEAIYRYV